MSYSPSIKLNEVPIATPIRVAMNTNAKNVITLSPHLLTFGMSHNRESLHKVYRLHNKHHELPMKREVQLEVLE
jgi:hypothetical protein